MRSFTPTRLLPALLISTLPTAVLSGNVLSTTGYSSCMSNPQVKISKLDVSYDKDSHALTFDVAGESKIEQKLKGEITVSAYGKEVYSKSFDPCLIGMKELCPVQARTFSSQGQETIPEEYASQIPSLAFSVPDLDGNVKMTLTNDGGDQVACIQSEIGNGVSLKMPVIKYVAAGIAVAALALSAVGAVAAGGHPGASVSSPTFGEVIGWFQSMATNGMLSVPYPGVYQSFTTNFAFSTGLIKWGAMQNSIDAFRKTTGGNLTDANYPYIKNQVTLVYDDGNQTSSSGGLFRRALNTAIVMARDGITTNVDGQETNVDGGASQDSGTSDSAKDQHYVSGLQAYVEQLTIPQENTFMTLLLVWAIVVAAIIVGILLAKVILELWAMLGQLPKSLESWRKRYWWRMAKAITNLILLLYGIWTLYCIYQFTNGDSWAAKVLAGITLGLFTAVLMWFTWRIYTKAHEYKKIDGDVSRLYEDKEVWIKYSLFYDNYKKNCWLFFVPAIVYMFAKGCVIAGGNNHGLVQAGGQLIIEAIMLGFLLWFRPYQRRSGKWINIVIHVVRVLSVICILVFVEELGISTTTKTITGVVLIVVQCVLTAILGILIAINAIITCVKDNPHRKQRKEAEKLNRDVDNLTPLDARNSLLMEPMAQQNTAYKAPPVTSPTFGPGDNKGRYDPVPRAQSPRPSRFERNDSYNTGLVDNAAGMGYRDRSRSLSTTPPSRQPTLPDLDFGYGRAR